MNWARVKIAIVTIIALLIFVIQIFQPRRTSPPTIASTDTYRGRGGKFQMTFEYPPSARLRRLPFQSDVVALVQPHGSVVLDDRGRCE